MRSSTLQELGQFVCSAIGAMAGLQPGRGALGQPALLTSVPQGGALHRDGAAAATSAHIRLVPEAAVLSLRSAAMVIAWHHRFPPPSAGRPRRGTGQARASPAGPWGEVWFLTAVVSRGQHSG